MEEFTLEADLQGSGLVDKEPDQGNERWKVRDSAAHCTFALLLGPHTKDVLDLLYMMKFFERSL